jgi:imidazolonepropionase-like amidohydrolase
LCAILGLAGAGPTSELSAEALAAQPLAIVHAAVVDVEAGRLIPDQTVLVEGERIVAVGAAGELRVPAGSRIVEAAERYLVPGFTDVRVHVLADAGTASAILPIFVAHGVTAIRDLGGSLEAARAAEEQAAESSAPVPRILASGPLLGGFASANPVLVIAVASPEEARRAVAQLVEGGARLVAVAGQLPRRAYPALMEAAASVGLPVAGAAPEALGAAKAAEAGQRTIDHPSDTPEPYCADPLACEALFAASQKAGTCHTPSLLPLRVRARLDDQEFLADPRLRWIPAARRSRWEAERQTILGAADSPSRVARLRSALWLAGALEIAGVPVLAGSGAGDLYAVPGAALHDELELLVRSGLTPAQALRAATVEPARCLGLDGDQGTIAAGRLADLVLLDADPLTDIRNTARVTAVVLRGRLLERSDLEALLAEAERSGGP